MFEVFVLQLARAIFSPGFVNDVGGGTTSEGKFRETGWDTLASGGCVLYHSTS